MNLNKIIYRSTDTVEDTIIKYNRQEIKYRWIIGILFVSNYIFYCIVFTGAAYDVII